MASPYPTNDKEFSAWIGNFLTVANANLATLGMTAVDITTLQALKTDLDARIAAEVTTKDAAKAATAAKETSRKAINTAASFRAKVITANPALPNALKEQLGVTVRSVKTITPPVPPTALVVAPDATGNNALSWTGKGNKAGTQYIVEVKKSQHGAFHFVGVTTKTKYDHKAQKPGSPAIYRVKALRSDAHSDYSTQTIAYGDTAFPLEDDGVV